MPFTQTGDIYEVDFIISNKRGNTWFDDKPARQYVVATSDQNAVSIVQSYMGQSATVNVKCHGVVRKILSGVIIAQ